MSHDCPNEGLINHIIIHSKTLPPDGSAPAQQQEVIPFHQAESDEQLIRLWLHGRSAHTQRAYQFDIKLFLAFVKKSLRSVVLADLQDYSDSLQAKGLAEGSRRRSLASVKSLFSFGSKLGFFRFNVAAALQVPPVRDTLSERILTDVEVRHMIHMENHPRNKLILKLLYISGVRVSELVSLKWKDIVERGEEIQISVFGKGAKTRQILLPEGISKDLLLFRQGSSDDSPLFRSRKQGGHLSTTQILRIVKKAAGRCGIDKPVSPHWLRHCHISHSLDNNCPIHLTQATCGHLSLQSTGRYLHARPSDSSSKYLSL
jgi:integrase/recombinase XerD